jgi:uncharacterized protein YjeT (DUF2065 family)
MIPRWPVAVGIVQFLVIGVVLVCFPTWIQKLAIRFYGKPFGTYSARRLKDIEKASFISILRVIGSITLVIGLFMTWLYFFGSWPAN